MTSDDQPTTPVGLRPETAVICAGHSDLLSGITIAHDQALAERIRHRRGLSGATPGALEAFLALRGCAPLPCGSTAASATPSAYAFGLGSTLASASASASGQAERQAATRQDTPGSQGAWARSGAWPPRAQTGKGEIPLGPSVKIMPVDSYSTLGRSCEPAFKWIRQSRPQSGRSPGASPGRGLRSGVRRSRVAGPRWAATRRAARSPDREAHPRSSRPDPGPDPLTGGRGRRVPARPEAPNSGIRPCLPALIRSA